MWGRLREGVPPVVIAARPPRLARVVEAAADAGTSLVVIDTAPREAGGAAEAARLADLVLIPCRPSAVDLAAIPATLAAVGSTPAAVVLNAVPARGPWVAEAADAVRAFGLGWRTRRRSHSAGRPIPRRLACQGQLDGDDETARQCRAHETRRHVGGEHRRQLGPPACLNTSRTIRSTTGT